MNKSSEEQRIRIGKIFNKIATVLFALFFIDTCVVVTMFSLKVYIISVVVIAVLFVICCIVSHICLKDYKPDE